MVVQVQKNLPNLESLSLLIVDDDHAILRSLQRVLGGLGAKVSSVSSVREASLSINNNRFDAVISDLQLKDGLGTELLPLYLGRQSKGAFYMLTGHGSVDNAVEVLKHGAKDYFEKPVDPIELAHKLEQDFAKFESTNELAGQLAPFLAVCDPAMLNALAELPWYAQGSEPVLIQGKSGTGKELVARAVHGLSLRAGKPFVAINCGAIPDSMLEAELFGHEKGAFTNATSTHRGCFEQAHQGTLFLDEIGEMPLLAQTALLRVLEQGVIKRVGGEKDITVDVRIVAATHKALDDQVEHKRFREDLFFRLNVLPIHIPRLKERPEDIVMLAKLFLEKALAQHNRDSNRSAQSPKFSESALAVLQQQHWPGNVRELRNFISRLAIRLPGDVTEISEELVRQALPQKKILPSIDEGVFIPKGTTLADAEWLLIDAALQQTGFNRAEAARLLGIGERTLRRKLNDK